jgi:cytochrome c biogenesis factor
VKINPLTNFIWIGSITMLLGGMLSLTPRALVIKMVSDKGDGE